MGHAAARDDCRDAVVEQQLLAGELVLMTRAACRSARADVIRCSL
jgi:hypothetical protein